MSTGITYYLEDYEIEAKVESIRYKFGEAAVCEFKNIIDSMFEIEDAHTYRRYARSSDSLSFAHRTKVFPPGSGSILWYTVAGFLNEPLIGRFEVLPIRRQDAVWYLIIKFKVTDAELQKKL